MSTDSYQILTCAAKNLSGTLTDISLFLVTVQLIADSLYTCDVQFITQIGNTFDKTNICLCVIAVTMTVFPRRQFRKA